MNKQTVPNQNFLHKLYAGNTTANQRIYHKLQKSNQRSKWCFPADGVYGLHAVYICEYDQNFKLLASKIPELLEYKDLLKRIVCNTNLRNCMLRRCDHCPTMNSLRTYLLELFNMHEIENLLCYQWQKDKNFYTMMQLNSTIEEFLDKVWKQAKFLCEHHYIKNSPGIELTNFK